MKRRPYWDFVKKYWYLAVLALALNAVSGCFRSIGAVYLQRITDTLELGVTSALMSMILWGAFFQATSYIFRWLGAIVPRYMGEKYARDVRMELMGHLKEIPYPVYESQSIGNLQSVIRNDSVQAGSWLYGMFSRILTNLCLFLSSVWVMARTDPGVTVCIIGGVCLSVAVNQQILNRMTIQHQGAREALGAMTGNLEKSFAGLETVKTYQAENWVKEKFSENVRLYCRFQKKATLLSMLSGAWCTLLAKLCMYAPLAYLGMAALQGRMSIGAVVMYVYLAREVVTPIEMIFRWMSNLTRYRAALRRVEAILDLPEEQKEAGRDGCSGSPREIRAKDLDFSYDGKQEVFSHFCLSLKKGETVLLSGESGKGKTTLMKVLLGLYASPHGTYYVDGNPIPDLSALTAYGSMENSVFPMSIYENISLGNPRIDRAACEEIMERLGFREWIRALPDGLDTKIQPDQISGGQRQAVAVARALLAGKPLILLDEPFSALDEEKYRLFEEEFDRQKREHMLLMTSHRTENPEWYDRVVRM